MAGSITVAGVSRARKLPGMLADVIFGGPGTSAGDAERRLLLLGNMLAADVTDASGASPAFTVSAGTYQTGGVALIQPVRVLSESDARERFGAGSELHLMCADSLAQYPDCPLYACPVTEATSGARASGLIYVSGTATAAGTLHLWVSGQPVDVEVVSGDSAAIVVAAITNALLNVPSLPVTAQYGSGPASPVTVTAKQFGTRGNLITLRGTWESGSRKVELPAVTSSSSPPATTATLAGLTLGFYAMGNAGTYTAKYLSSGSGSDAAAYATTLAAVGKDVYHLIAVAAVDGTTSNTTLDRARTWLTAQATPTKGIRQQLVSAQVTTLSASIGAGTVSAYLNHARMQTILHPRAEQLPCQIAASVGAARLNGDVAAGGRTVGEAADVAANLDGLRLVTITQQPYDGDRMAADDPDTALQYGLTPLVPSAGRAGYVEVARSITSRWKDDAGASNYGVLDTSDVTVTDDVARDLVASFAVEFKGLRLAHDSPDGAPPKVERTTTPTFVRAWLLAKLKTREANGHIIEVDDRFSLLKVEAQSGSAWRLNAEVPVVPAPGLHVFAANIRQLSARL